MQASFPKPVDPFPGDAQRFKPGEKGNFHLQIKPLGGDPGRGASFVDHPPHLDGLPLGEIFHFIEYAETF
jgi:hypothetical protein